jgi:prepilin-type N-terminal cleavage/methylation domain-containing protein
MKAIQQPQQSQQPVRSGRRLAPAGDAGFTLIELLVSMVIVGILGGIAAASILNARTSTGDAVERSAEWNSMVTASTMLRQDVTDAWVIRSAKADEFIALIRRADPESGTTRCAVRDWKVDGAAGTLTLTSTVFQNADCTGDADAPRVWVTIPRVDGAQTAFSYYLRDTGREIPIATMTGGAVQDGHDVGLVAWKWNTQPYAEETQAAADELSFSAKQMARADGSDPANRSTAIQAQPSILTVSTVPEGRAQPQLTWTSPTPTVVASWVIDRFAAREGDQAASDVKQDQFWVQDPTELAYTDNSLPAGWTARYTVHAALKNASAWNVGPESNAVVTGPRPATVTNVVATGAPTSIAITWDPQVGSTGYDVFRDGVLVGWTTGNASTTFTDGPSVGQGWTGSGYGHAHNYQVVATNRWENLLTTGDQGKNLAPSPSETTTKTYTGAVRLVSADTAASGAFTAPVPPTLVVTPTTSWGMTVAWTPAGWTGSGPTTKDGVSRDRGWTVATNGSNTASPNASWTPEWSGTENAAGTTSRLVSYTQGTVAGQYRTYTAATCNAIGCSTASAAATALQRPPTPTCTAVATSTRGATVTVARPAIVSAYVASQVTGGVQAAGASSITGTGTAAGTAFAVDGLAHSSSQTFTASSQNGSPAGGGWSDTATCSTTTPVLAVAISGVTSTTRSVSATATATNGTAQTIGLSGKATIAGLVGSWDPLSQATGYTVTATNTDNVNTVSASAPVTTATLTRPAMPACSVTISGPAGSAILTVSGGDQVKVGSGGTTYASPHSYGGLVGGTYTGWARNVNADGFNQSLSSWTNCGSGFVPTIIGSGYVGWDAVCAAHADDGQVRDDLFASASSTLGTNAQGEYISAPELAATGAVVIGSVAGDGSFRCGFSVGYQSILPDGSKGDVATGSIVVNYGAGGAVLN